MASSDVVNERGEIIIPDPPLRPLLFSTTRFAWLWLIIRVYLGWQWLTLRLGQDHGGTWASGESLKGFWTNAVAFPRGQAADRLRLVPRLHPVHAR